MDGPASGQTVRIMFESSPMGMCAVLRDGTLLRANEAFRDQFGEGAHSILDVPASGNDRETLARSLLAVVEGVETMFRLEVATRSERVPWVEISGIAMRGATGDAMLHVLDVTERHRRETALREQARRDPLTGLHNRLAFAEVLRSRLATAPVGTLLFIDLDNFKNVNDTRGHKRGDDVLIAVAGALQASIEGSEVARLGGDEFAMLVPSAAPVKMNIGAMLNRRIAVAATVAAGGLPVTASIGMVQLRHGATPESLLEDADRAMYTAKRLGKDRCIEATAATPVA
jgi:diguanylate cyclase (GGDEF)-like protein/PAS domain S-box-containing protein